MEYNHLSKRAENLVEAEGLLREAVDGGAEKVVITKIIPSGWLVSWREEVKESPDKTLTPPAHETMTASDREKVTITKDDVGTVEEVLGDGAIAYPEEAEDDEESEAGEDLEEQDAKEDGA